MKDCLIIGPVHSMIRKEVSNLLKKKILTVTERAVDFLPVLHQEGNWLTTLKRSVDMSKRKLTKTYNPQEYPHYDDYDAIECTNKKNIPIDYNGNIGVPITFFYWYPELDYEIIDGPLTPKLNGKNKFQRLIIRRKQL